MVHPPITLEPPRIHLVLADIYRLYSSPRIGLVTKKLLFYFAALNQLGRQDWLQVERGVVKEIDKLETELNSDSDVQAESRRNALLL